MLPRKHTNLQVSDGIIMLALVDGTPRILNLKECLYYYLEHQKEVIEALFKIVIEYRLYRILRGCQKFHLSSCF